MTETSALKLTAYRDQAGNRRQGGGGPGAIKGVREAGPEGSDDFSKSGISKSREMSQMGKILAKVEVFVCLFSNTRWATNP